MPYLKQDFRDELREAGLGEFGEYMSTVHEDTDWAGAINYVNYTFLKDRMTRDEGKWKRYWKFALWVGTMLCCVLEVYRRIISEYEQEAIKKNGDVL